MSKNTLFTLLRLLITIALLAFVLSRVDVAAVTTALTQANPLLVALAILLYGVAVFCTSLKWGILLRAQNVAVPMLALLRYTLVGTFFNNFLPTAVGGDLMRGYELAQYTQRRADAAVSVVVDRLLGLMALAATCAVSVLYAELSGTSTTDLSGAFGVALLVTVGLGVGFVVLVSRRIRQLIGNVLEAIATKVTFLHPIVPLYENIAGAIGAYRNQPRILLLALGMGILPYLFSNAVNYILSLALAPTAVGRAPISVLDIFIFNPLIGLGQLIPISIGGLGLNQNLYDSFYHQLLGYDQSHVIAVSFLMQFVIYMTSIPGGVIWWQGRGAARPSAPVLDSQKG